MYLITARPGAAQERSPSFAESALYVRPRRLRPKAGGEADGYHKAWFPTVRPDVSASPKSSGLRHERLGVSS